MAARGKSISVFLMDGVATGRIKASLSNWTGVAYKIPRSTLDSCKERDDLNQSSVYFLFGQGTLQGKSSVYIGQASIRKNGGGLLSRLMEHDKNPEKDYWTDAVVFTTSNNSFGPTELNYLENCFCNLAISAGRYEVRNANEPSQGNITEEKENELQEYADYARLILGVLGYKVFEKLESYEQDAPRKSGVNIQKATSQNVRTVIPDLPCQDLKVGEFVRLAMRGLAASGYCFSDEELLKMSTPEWSIENFHTQKAFIKNNPASEKDNKGPDGRPRFWSECFDFGGKKVLVSKEWYEKQRQYFVKWYLSLK